MRKTFKHEDIEKILSEADDLIERVSSDTIKDIKEEHRVQFEKQAQGLKKLRSEVKDRIGKEEPAQSGPYGDGIHEAIDDIATAMKNLGRYLS